MWDVLGFPLDLSKTMFAQQVETDKTKDPPLPWGNKGQEVMEEVNNKKDPNL